MVNATGKIDLRATQHTRSRYDLVAPLYDALETFSERSRFRHWRRELWKRVNGPNVLEIGVGTGKNINYYPQNSRITAIDLSKKMLDRARQTAKQSADLHIDLKIMDAQNLEFPDEEFDCAVATFVFCSVPDPILGLQEARRVTKTGGQLFLLEHMLSSKAPLAWLMQKSDRLIHWMTGFHIARLTEHNVQAAGWQIDKVIALNSTNIFRMILAHK
ncbi:MAG: class I SAM-dependent methyltransferase [Chloroflexi bacterium]|nr:class I SAM-dependent methyltransferase [Chloroflexota bacterium]